jgi:hypothetical protein
MNRNSLNGLSVQHIECAPMDFPRLAAAVAAKYKCRLGSPGPQIVTP